MIMRRHIHKRLHRCRGLEFESVPESLEDVACFDELVEEVVVSGGIGKEVFAAGKGEGEEVGEEGDHFGGAVQGPDVRDVGGEEAEEGEEGAPELGPVVGDTDFGSAEVGEEAEENAE